MDAGAGRGMADCTQATTIIGAGTTRRHHGYSTITGRGNQHTLQVRIKGMASTAGVMDLAIRHADRRAGCRTGSRRMARNTSGACAIDHAAVVHCCMTVGAVIGRCRRGIVMNASSRIGRYRMAGQTSCQSLQARRIT